MRLFKNAHNFLSSCMIAGLAFLTLGCSEYQKLLNSQNHEKKLKAAKEYYNNEEYQKALPLFDDLVSYYRGTKQGRKIAYYHAYCHYGVGSYKVAAFRFKNYYNTYSRSAKAEEALYMHAYCLYLQSPRIELDQKTTREAINAFKLFIQKFPNSEKISKCNKYIDQLRDKLRQKAYQKAYLWYKILDFKAAVTAFNNLLNQYPGINNREKVEFLILESQYKVAKKSVQSKKEERYRRTLQIYRDFVRRYPDSRFMDEAKEIRNETKSALKKYNL